MNKLLIALTALAVALVATPQTAEANGCRYYGSSTKRVSKNYNYYNRSSYVRPVRSNYSYKSSSRRNSYQNQRRTTNRNVHSSRAYIANRASTRSGSRR